MVAGAAAFGFALYELLKTGTCASGGPYVVARECPSGTGLRAGLLVAGLLVFLVGAALFATRGRRATEPGLPPDSTASNPPPFTRYPGPN